MRSSFFFFLFEKLGTKAREEHRGELQRSCVMRTTRSSLNSKTAVHLELRLPPPESRSLVSYADTRCDFGLAKGAWEKEIPSRMFRG